MTTETFTLFKLYGHVTILGIYLSTKECIFVKGKIIYTFLYTQIIYAHNFISRALVNKMIHLQHKIYIINVMNCLILRQIEHLVLKLVFCYHRGII